MLAVVVADAPGVDLDPFRGLLQRAELRIAADGGARYLRALGAPIDLLIGDLDSVAPELLAELEQLQTLIERHPVEKAETDLELALLRAVDCGAQHIAVLAALGGRPDQHMANLLLLAHPQLRGRQVVLYDGRWRISLIEQQHEIAGRPGDLISLLPLGTARGIQTHGLYYPLHDESLLLGPARGVSNLMVADRALVTVREGLLLLFHCHDEGTPHGRPADT